MEISQNFKKLSNLFINLKSMANYLTNCRVLTHLVEKCKAVEDSYFQAQQKVQNQEKT